MKTTRYLKSDASFSQSAPKETTKWQIERLSNNPMVNVHTFRVEIPHTVTKPKHTRPTRHRLRTFSLHSQGRWSTGRSRWSYPSRESSRCSGGLPDLKVTKGKSKGGREKKETTVIPQSVGQLSARCVASPTPMQWSFCLSPPPNLSHLGSGTFGLPRSIPYCR